MSKLKSPFLVFQDFASPKICESILDSIKVPKIPQRMYDMTDTSFGKMERYNPEWEPILYNRFEKIIPEIESHYNLKIKQTEKMLFQYFPEGAPGPAEAPGCQSSAYVRKKWVKVKDRDLTGILWLKNYNQKVPVDARTEVYGGRLEFPQYNFSLNPQMGTLILFPAGPHFISAISQVLAGDLYQVRVNMAAENQWLYQPEDFGAGDKDWNYSQWFKDYT